jgi:branched-chain amino acid transport system substrate-binding protein
MRKSLLVALAAGLVLAAGSGAAPSDPGVTSDSILLGGTVPLSGEAASGGLTARGAEAYFKYVNARGGVNGRKITFRYLDDGYDPGRTVQATRELVQQDRVFAMFNTLGTAHNLAIRRYLNEVGVPHLFVASGYGGFGREARLYPWTMGFIPTYTGEGIIYGRHIVRTMPRARIAVLYQDDEYGRELLSALRKGLGPKARQIVAVQRYSSTASDVQSQVARLKASRANTLMIFAFGKFAIQAFVYVNKLGWRPRIFVNAVAGATTVMQVASEGGLNKRTLGALTIAFFKDPANIEFQRDSGIRLFRTILRRHGGGDTRNGYYLAGMAAAHEMVQVLRRAGRNLTRRSVMTAARRLDDRSNPFVLPGIRVKTSARDAFPIEQVRLQRWTRRGWVGFGRLLSAPRG